MSDVSRLERLLSLLSSRLNGLACPLCGAALCAPEGASLRCAKGHCFDVARKGYVNFACAGTLAHYDRALFLARRAVFDAGCYAPVADALRGVLRTEAARLGRPPRVLDAGCGEGYYAAALARDGCEIFGVDLSRDAVALAAQRPEPVCWCVADLTRLPLAPGSMDVVIDVLSPANYASFRRALRPGGLLVKVAPGQDYLRELRAALEQGPYAPQDVIDYFGAHMTGVCCESLRYTCAVDGGLREAFFRMTPLTGGRTLDAAALASIRDITIDLRVLTGRFA